MASVNKVIILGRLGRDPEAKTAQSGTAICNLNVATSRRYKDKSGEKQEETEWHTVAVFGRQAEVAQQYLQKGSEVYIEGRLRTRSYEKDGIKRYSTEIICESLQLGARANAAPAQGDAPSGFESPASRPTQSRAGFGSMPDEDIPF